jgi:hypothetical protein
MAGRIAYYGNTVTNGLVLSLDAAKRDSYPGSGTAWRDISGNGNNGTLTNGPTFNSDNGGSIVFDGTNDRIDIAGTVISGSQNFTIECACRSLAANTAEYIFGNYGVANNGIELYFYLNELILYYGGTYLFSPDNSILSNTWYIVTATRNGNNVALYINGALSSSGANSNSITTNNPYTIGNAYDYNSEIFRGNIASVKVYNRALSNIEILQNYNAQKSRYGL